MSDLPSLQPLAAHRDALLLAEAIGWLHDYRKCSEEHLQTQSPHSKAQALSRAELANRQPNLQNISLALQSIQQNSRSVSDLLNDQTWNQDSLGNFLSRCHNTAHFDKQEPTGGEQTYPGVQISSPFGFEQPVGTNLTQNLWSLPWSDLAQVVTTRQRLKKQISSLFSQAIADSRRPINEIDLWSWGMLVGALYKASLAGTLLTGQVPAPRDLKWRLLAVRVNGLDYLLSAVRIPDLLARQEILANSLQRVRELLEEIYPLGSEVYRDENGSVFVVPDIPDLLEIQDGNNLSLRHLIVDAFARGTTKNNQNIQIDKEIIPHIELEPQAWWGQDPGWPNSNNDELPKIGDLIAQKPRLYADPVAIYRYWSREIADVCPVCGLRPQGPGPTAKERKVCDICEERRADRSKNWAMERVNTTIWNDEVADGNGRFALLVGRFDLTYWLDGSLVQTLTISVPQNGQAVLKNPSFARLRRIWETTQRFWKDVKETIQRTLTDDRRRLKIYLDILPNLGSFHVYDLDLSETELSVVWVSPQNGSEGYLLTVDNLSYIARHLGASEDEYQHPATAAIFVEDYLQKQFVRHGANKANPVLRNSDVIRSRAENLPAGCQITGVEYQQNDYAVFIPILAEPRTFMALVPADRALEVLKAIKIKFEREMGKVRNRLPLHLGLVFADRRMPLMAVLDAGRQMLAQTIDERPWTVRAKTDHDPLPDGKPGCVKLDLARKNQEIRLDIPTAMGDGATFDTWYLYWRVEGKPTDRDYWFIGPDGECWVHVSDLRPGDTVHFTPSTLDFEYLDSASRRFAISYEADGRRFGRPTRPYCLEDLERLEKIWEVFSKLSRTQVKQVLQTIEITRERWFGRDETHRSASDPVFRRFVEDTLANAEWDWKTIENSEQLITAAARGELADLAELHLEILKEK